MNAEQLDIKLEEDIISDHQLAHFAEATKEDAIFSDLQQVFLSGWQDSKGQVPPNAQEFWNYRDEFTVAQGLIVKGQKIVVPSSLRGEMLEKLHEGHLGINKAIARAQDVLFWPRMSVEITEKIKNCPVCLENQPSQQPEPLKSHEIPPSPWAKVGTDILHKNGQNYLITVDYYSKWPEMTLLLSMTSTGVITALKSQFARYEVPSAVVSLQLSFLTMAPVTTLQNLGSFQKTGVLNTSLQVLATHNPMASQRELSRPLKQCWRKLVTHTKLSFLTEIHPWRS